MKLIDTVRVEGFLVSDGEEFGWEELYYRSDGKSYTLIEAHIINSLLLKLNEEAKTLIKDKSGDWDYDDYEIEIPNVGLQLFFTDKKSTLEEAEEFLILEAHGLLDGSESWFGYSEYTILGYYVDRFTVGNHDILDILTSHEGKYCHIVMNVYEEEEK